MPGINKDKLEKAAEKVFNRCNYFNDYVLQTIGRRINSIGQLSAYDQQTLKNMADISGDMESITKKLAEITGQNIKDIEKIYTQTVSDGVNSYKPLYDFKNMDFVPYEQNEFAQQLVKHWFKETAGEMINLSRTKAIGFDKYDLKGNVIGHTPLEGAFQKAIDDAVAAVSTAAVDFNTAMRETVINLGGSGVKVTYGSGVNRSLSAMVRQNLLYGAKQPSVAYDDYISNELGCDGFEVDAHAGCRPKHEFMQGQMYSYDGEKRINGITYKDGSEALARLSDYGCLHFKTGVILGVSEPRYSKEELDRIHKETTEPIEYDGRTKTLYEWKQTQRKIEREIRKESQIRDMAKETGNNVLANDCNFKINTYRTKYDDMCQKIGLEPKYERMRTYTGTSAKIVDNGEKDGIIKGVKTVQEVQDVHYVGKIDKNIYKCVTEDIKTDEVIITDERIQHIKERHPNDYERYCKYIPQIISEPDYIIEANKRNTAVILKEIEDKNEKFKLILRIAVKKDPKDYKNSVISFWKVGEATWKKSLKNKKILYKPE